MIENIKHSDYDDELSMIYTLTDKINELIEKVNELEGKEDFLDPVPPNDKELNYGDKKIN